MRSKSTTNPGYFIFSLDTELSSGYFDNDAERKKLFSSDGVLEREKITRILALLDEYQIIATWAVVGHIFYERCENCEICPILEWQNKFSSFDEVYKTANPLWYGADVIEILQKTSLDHEIAFHGYTHEIFNQISREKAEIEIQEFIRVANRKGIVAKSVVFPRNQVGHLDLFEKYGFTSYRGEEALPLITRNKYIVGKIAKILDHVLGISMPPIYKPEELSNGKMINLTATQHIFGFDRKVEIMLDQRGLSRLRIRRIRKAIETAAKQGKVVHIWAHPWEFRTEADFDKLAYIFECVQRQVGLGLMKSVSMMTMAAQCAESALMK